VSPVIFNPAIIDCARSSVTLLLYLCLVDGMQFTYSPNNPTVGETLIVTWARDPSEAASFSLGLLNRNSNTGYQQIQDVDVPKEQTTGTVSFTPTEPG
jgi:hypothetical protein